MTTVYQNRGDCVYICPLSRFVELFESAQYEDAAFHAARSPRGVLRNLHIMEMFEGGTHIY